VRFGLELVLFLALLGSINRRQMVLNMTQRLLILVAFVKPLSAAIENLASQELRKPPKSVQEKRSPTKIASGDVAWF
jgi:hypothetical protein